MTERIDHVIENRRHWDARADEWVAAGERAWAAIEPYWGIWELPDAGLELLPTDMSGWRAIELGCGTGYVSAWMARRGASVIGIDNSVRQLTTARRLAELHRIRLALVHGDAERVPAAACSFDFAVSEYGAAIWCDPHLWIPEAHRLLVPGGSLVFLGCHPLGVICIGPEGENASDRLARPYFAMHTFDWTEVAVDPGGVEFNLTVSDWLRLFDRVGFDVDDYLELQAPESATATKFWASPGWGRRWPVEQVWKLRKR
ncbi:MAG: class I SAM-dependent methyltransferase [Acidimicrobiales bacterium]